MFYFETIKINNESKKVLKSSIFKEYEEKFQHLFTTKESFVTTGEEEFDNIAKTNKNLIFNYLKIKEENLFQIKQTHTSNIAICTKTPDIKDKTDGIILKKQSSASFLNFADCTPIILYDPENNIVSGLHAGWRGTAGEICKKSIEILKKNFNTKPDKLLAAIGPCISKEDFKTDENVYTALQKTIKNFEHKNNCFDFNNGKFYPDLAGINACQLAELGVSNIDICKFKTTSNNELFFSYRKENKTTNRISMFIKLI